MAGAKAGGKADKNAAETQVTIQTVLSNYNKMCKCVVVSSLNEILFLE